MQAKRSCQAAMESTTLRTFTQPLPGGMKSCYPGRNVAIMFSCTSNLAGTWCASSTSAACWGARVAGPSRPFAPSGPNTFTATTTKRCTKTYVCGSLRYTPGNTLGHTICSCGGQGNAQCRVAAKGKLVTRGKKQRGPPSLNAWVLLLMLTTSPYSSSSEYPLAHLVMGQLLNTGPSSDGPT